MVAYGASQRGWSDDRPRLRPIAFLHAPTARAQSFRSGEAMLIVQGCLGAVERLARFPWPDPQHPGLELAPSADVRVRIYDRQRNYALDRIGSGEYLAVLARELHLPESAGKGFGSRDGSWLEIGYDGDGLVITTDRLGTLPIYWCREGDSLLLSSRLTDLALGRDRSLEPNIAAAREMILLEHNTSDDTLLEGVSLLHPASVCKLNRHGQPSVRRYWAPPPMDDSHVEDAEPWVARGIEALVSAHGRHGLDDPAGLALPVTAGLDSRCNLALHRRHLSEAHLFHCHDLGRVELPYARRIARELGQPLRVYDSAPGMRRITDEPIDLGPGEFNLGHWRLVGVARRLAEQGLTATIDGFFQDLLFKATFLREAGPERQVRDRFNEAVYRARKAGLGEAVTVPLQARLTHQCQDGEKGLDFSQRCYIEQRSRRLVSNIVRLNRQFLCVRTPALDARLMDFGLAVPWQLRRDSYLYRRIIHGLDARLAAVPYDKTGLPLLDPRKRSRTKAARRMFRPYLDRVWPGRPFLQVPEGNFARLARRDRVFRTKARAVLSRSEWLREVLEDDRPERVMDNGDRMGQAAVDCLGGMLTVARLEEAVTSLVAGESPGR